MSQTDEQRVLGLILSDVAKAREVQPEWWTHPANRAVHKAVLDTGSADITVLVEKLSERAAPYLIGVAQQSWAPENFGAFVRSMRIRYESKQFVQSLRKLEGPSGKGRLFADI